MRTAIAFVLLIFTAAPNVLAVDRYALAISPIIEEGTAARERNEWSAADAAYRRALDVATELGATLWQFRAWFYIGLVKQVEAETAGDPARKEELLRQSRAPYQTALTLNAESTATRINLAEVESTLGNHREAIRLLEEALAIKTTAEIAQHLGDAYGRFGDRTGAARAYGIAAQRDPDNGTVHEKLLTVLLAEDSAPGSELTGYLWALIQNKRIDRALDSGARALAHPALSVSDGRAVLTMFATALARKDYDAAAFDSSPAAAKIDALLAGSSPHRAALQALVSAYRGAIDQAVFAVWADNAPLVAGTADYPTPLVAFRDVLRSIASGLSRQEKHESAVAYYRLALSLDPQRIDPASVRALASIFATRRNLPALAALDAQYEQSMSRLSGSDAESEEVYEYFRLMGQVKNRLSPRNPLASGALDEFERAKAAGGTGIVEPELYEQLARMYKERGEIDKSNGEKFAAANAYMARGNLQLARLALAGLGHAPTAGFDRHSYEHMVHRLVPLPDSVRRAVPAEQHFTVKRNVLLLCGGAPKADRAKAAAELKKLGITVDVEERNLLVQMPDGQGARSTFFLPNQ